MQIDERGTRRKITAKKNEALLFQCVARENCELCNGIRPPKTKAALITLVLSEL
jgi:hypothetical protein